MKKPKVPWTERLKSLLILLLTVSAVWMLILLFVGSRGRPGLIPQQAAAEQVPTYADTQGPPLPAVIVITSPAGRYGVQQDRAIIGSLFARVSPLLEDALTAAGPAAEISEADWQQGLSQEGLYLDFRGEIPFSVLAGSLANAEGPLAGSTRRLLLCAGAEEDQVLLRWQDPSTHLFYSSTTALNRSLHLSALAAEYNGNGTYFAYESEELSQLVSPYTLVTGDSSTGEYTASNPLSGTDLSAVLSTLSFSSQNHTRISSGEVYVDGGDRLEVRDNGTLTYRSSVPGKYPAGNTLAESVQAARTLAERALSSLSGSGEVCLLDATQSEDGISIHFGYRLDGSPVVLANQDWCASFTARGGYLTEYTLVFRTYTPSDNHIPLLPISRAALILPDLTDQRLELYTQYRDSGDRPVALEWVAR